MKLLLVLLLLVRSHRWLATKNWTRPDDECRSQRFRNDTVRGSDRHGDTQFTLRLALVYASRGRHVGIISSDRDADVAIASSQIVSGIERQPSHARHQRFHPGVRCSFDRSVLGRLIAMEHVSADVAAWNVQA